jgi:hypothetical protein
VFCVEQVEDAQAVADAVYGDGGAAQDQAFFGLDRLLSRRLP